MQKLLTKRERAILFITVAVIIFTFAFNFVIVPVYTKNDLLNKEIRLAGAKLKKYLWLLNQKEAIQAQFSQISSASFASGQQQDTLVSALSELENLAKDANIRIVDIRPQGASESSALEKGNLIELRTEGAMEEYLKFIYNLERSPSFLKIKKFRLTAKPQSQTLEGNFTVIKPSIY